MLERSDLIVRHARTGIGEVRVHLRLIDAPRRIEKRRDFTQEDWEIARGWRRRSDEYVKRAVVLIKDIDFALSVLTQCITPQSRLRRERESGTERASQRWR